MPGRCGERQAQVFWAAQPPGKRFAVCLIFPCARARGYGMASGTRENAGPVSFSLGVERQKIFLCFGFVRLTLLPRNRTMVRFPLKEVFPCYILSPTCGRCLLVWPKGFASA